MAATRRSLRRSVLIALACTGGLIAAAMAVGIVRSDDGGSSTPTVSEPYPPSDMGGGLLQLSADSLPPASAGSSVVIDRELYVVGSGGRRSWLARYSIDDHRLERLPDPPFDRPVAGAQVVAAPGGLIAVGVRCDRDDPRARADREDYGCYPGSLAAATYDGAKRRWDDVDIPAEAQTPPGSHSDAARAVGSIGSDAVFRLGGRPWAFDAAERDWRAVDLPAGANHDSGVCAAGRFLITWRPIPNTALAAPEQLREHLDAGMEVWTSSDAGATWTEALAAPLSPDLSGPNSYRLVCGRDTVVAWDPHLTQVRQLDLASSTWNALASPPAPSSVTAGAVELDAQLTWAAWTGGEYVFWRSPLPAVQGWAIAPGGAWRPVEAGPLLVQDQVTWFEGTAYLLGTSTDGPALMSWTPRPSTGAPPPMPDQPPLERSGVMTPPPAAGS